MQSPTVRSALPGELSLFTSMLLLAFSSDPVSRWAWKDPHLYISHFPAFLEAFGGAAFDHTGAHVAGDWLGGTLWLPPGVAPDTGSLLELLGRTVAEPVLSQAFSMFGQIAESHPPGPHWHLAFAGVDPARHGQGVGSALLRHTLARIDEDRLPAYLESSNPKNVPLYQRHGFEVVREIRVGDSPPVFPMIRPPR